MSLNPLGVAVVTVATISYMEIFSVSVAEERPREALPRKRRARGPGFPSESTIQNVVAHPDSARNRWSTNATQTDLRLHFSMELIDVFVGFVS
jgi:hypothetical protein